MSRAYRNTELLSRLTDTFEDDNHKKLLSSTMEGRDPLEVTYLSNGNINSKSDAGSHYYYNPDKTNAVDSVINSPATPGNMSHIIEYNSYNLTTGISGGLAGYTITFNPQNQRIRTVYSPSGSPAVIRYYSGGYEKTDSNGVVKETHYVYSQFGLVVVIVKDSGSVKTFYVETDHLGSIIGLINPDKTYAKRASFDPWGRRRNPDNWSYDSIPVSQITDRGFTGHEHLDAFGLINMNGRMYDPVLGRFLGVDPVIQAPDFSQCFNGYSYCLNNPLILYDPKGFEFRTVEEMLVEAWNRTRQNTYTFNYYNDGELAYTLERDADRSYDLALDFKVLNILIDLAKGGATPSSKTLQSLNNEKISPWLVEYLRFSPFLFPPIRNPFILASAIMFDGGATLTGAEWDLGVLIMLVGNDAGEVAAYKEIAAGGGIDIGLGAEFTRIDFSGDTRKLTMAMLSGKRTKFYFGIESVEGVSAIGAISYAIPESGGGIILGTSFQVGLGLTAFPPISAGFNIGTIELFKKF